MPLSANESLAVRDVLGAVTELLVHGLAQRLAAAGMSFPPASHLLSLVICACLAELSSGPLLA